MGRLAFSSALALVLVACGGGDYRAPVETREALVTARQRPALHTVAAGDTLYAIAWRYGMDYRALARYNGIGADYRIYPGQQLKLHSDAAAVPAAAKGGKPPTKSKPTAAPRKKPAPPAKAPVAKKAAPGPLPGGWRWPATGKVVREFSGEVHQGIDIAGETGDPIVAAADGIVVYSGSAIAGYGKLLIVKHSEAYLSAYGHNDRLLAKEGDSVRAGQKIAAKGSTATSSVKLHFEIRREGKPINPKKLLPRR